MALEAAVSVLSLKLVLLVSFENYVVHILCVVFFLYFNNMNGAITWNIPTKPFSAPSRSPVIVLHKYTVWRKFILILRWALPLLEQKNVQALRKHRCGRSVAHAVTAAPARGGRARGAGGRASRARSPRCSRRSRRSAWSRRWRPLDTPHCGAACTCLGSSPARLASRHGTVSKIRN